MQTLVLLATLAGVITTYTAADYGGGVLYCDCGTQPPLTYRADLAFIAVPENILEPGGWQCGDMVRVLIDGADPFWARVLDAGPLQRYHVEQWAAPNGAALPIVGDVPEHLWPLKGLSAPGALFNESMFNRMSRDAMMGHIE